MTYLIMIQMEVSIQNYIIFAHWEKVKRCHNTSSEVSKVTGDRSTYQSPFVSESWLPSHMV